MQFSKALNPRRVARSLSTMLVITLLQIAIGVNAPYAGAASGSVGPSTTSGTCASTVGETSYVTATFVNDTFCLLKFSTTTTWTVPAGVVTFDLLLVGGGGGGGADGGGGGGGGGVGTVSGIAATAAQQATITVGLGGNGVIHTPGTAGSAGGTSSVVHNGTTYSANGGAVAGGYSGTASYAAAGSVSANVTNLISGDISKGGRNSVQTPGGFGGAGSDGPSTSFVTGSAMYFAGGGGGGTCAPGNSAANTIGMPGGNSGGGRGSQHTENVGSDAGQPGTDGLGGGGGGGSACDDGPGSIFGTYQRTAGGRGGNGVVYIRYVPPTTISAHPQATTGAMGGTVTFTATPNARVLGPTRTKKWQILVPSGSWTDIASTDADTFATPTITRSMQGNQYRYVVTETYGTLTSTTYSNAATLTVSAPIQGDSDTALGPGSASKNYASLNYAGTEIVKPASSDAFTIEAWVNPTNICSSTSCAIIGREENYVLSYANGELTFQLWNSTAWGTAQITGVKIPLDQWSHVALTKSSTTWRLHVNGVQTYSATLSYAPTATTSYLFYIGNRNGGSFPFKGYIDEVKMWRSTRSASEIATDMNRTVTNDSNLYAYWNFNEATGTKAYNQVPGVSGDTDLTMYASDLWDSDSISTREIVGPYAVHKFKRSYLTLNGGWKSPPNIKKVTALVVAGGGGGGSRHGGGGGAGGLAYAPTFDVLPENIYQVVVGTGGLGYGQMGNGSYTGALGASTGTDSTGSGLSGKNSFVGRIGISESITAIGGGGGSASSVGGGSSGGANNGSATVGSSTQYSTSYFTGFGNVGGQGYSGSSCGTDYCGGGGGGAGGPGGTPVLTSDSSSAGLGGAGKMYSISGEDKYYAGGGGGAGKNATSAAAGGSSIGGTGGKASEGLNATANTGSGGGGGGHNGGTSYRGGNGSLGVVIIRYITALSPTYTKPVNAYLNAGMTETFTTNVAQDSATAMLTRTFKWESTTPTANGAYTLIKQGTGAANAAFSWVPTDTTTSGSGYLYRLTVTDSDTAGLFITDSSTAFATINQALRVTGSSTIPKAINLAKSETFTISLGTSTYKATLSPVIPGITLDTSTAGFAVIKIADTATVGTYSETLTVIDSVSASVVFPIIIKVQAPPQLTNTGEVVADGQVFNLDFSNSASYSPVSQTFADISGSKKTITAPNGGTYSNDFSGIYTLSSTSSQYLSATAFSMLPKWTIETYIRINETPTAQFCPFASEYASSSISMLLCVDAARTVFTGFFDIVGTSHKWSFKRSEEKIPLNTWVHIVGTFDGIDANLYFDSISTTPNSADGGRYDAGKVPPTPNTNRVFIGKDYPTTVGTTPNISLGLVRAYSTGFTQLQVQQNFNATKTRFESSNQTQIKPTKKYGTLVLDSFTSTSGYDTKTVTLAVGDRAGIDWDTTTVTNQVRISIQESLTVGTYFDTVTVTDSLGQSSYLPITFTVSKADTITVTMGTAHTAVYVGTAPAGAPSASISGLVGVDTATVETQYSGTYIDSSLRCAEGGSCSVGDVGPGGGWVFYISSTPINAAIGVSNGGIYLEAAPRNWNGDASGEASSSFASVLTNVNGTSSAIGSGAENSRILKQELGDSATAVTKALNKTINGVDDWFVPSYDELTRMITVLIPLGLGSFEATRNLWSSTQNTNPNKANNAWSSNPPVLNELLKTDNYYLRPIRAFSPTYYSTVTPSEVDTYTAQGTNLTFQVGAASNYQAVIYDTSILKITQANQKQLALNLYGAVAGTPFTLQISGGSGTGAVTETITAGSTAVNCRVSNKVLSNETPSTEQKTCNISITKASSRNYKAETLTATVYFMMFVNNQPTNQVGGGTVIALNGVTSFETSTVTPPSITGFSTLTLSLGAGGSFTITGTGFTGSITVKFSRNKVVSATSGDGRTIEIPVSTISSAGAASGRVVVITAAGEAVSDQSLTITP